MLHFLIKIPANWRVTPMNCQRLFLLSFGTWQANPAAQLFLRSTKFCKKKKNHSLQNSPCKKKKSFRIMISHVCCSFSSHYFLLSFSIYPFFSLFIWFHSSFPLLLLCSKFSCLSVSSITSPHHSPAFSFFSSFKGLEASSLSMLMAQEGAITTV